VSSVAFSWMIPLIALVLFLVAETLASSFMLFTSVRHWSRIVKVSFSIVLHSKHISSLSISCCGILYLRKNICDELNFMFFGDRNVPQTQHTRLS
jgi:hypothetical protein